jgi:hypothetical protein
MANFSIYVRRVYALFAQLCFQAHSVTVQSAKCLRLDAQTVLTVGLCTLLGSMNWTEKGDHFCVWTCCACRTGGGVWTTRVAHDVDVVWPWTRPTGPVGQLTCSPGLHAVWKTTPQAPESCSILDMQCSTHTYISGVWSFLQIRNVAMTDRDKQSNKQCDAAWSNIPSNMWCHIRVPCWCR